MSETVIKVENLSKQYRLGTIGSGTLYRDLQSWWAKLRGKEDPNTILNYNGGQNHNTNENFWALKDISFEIKQGDVVGVIGRNGAGKSTLLKILSRVTGPTSGLIKIKGRVASLLEVGTGFHPELTGRENVYLNGTILGMRKAEIDRKFDEIVDFAEIEKFIDTPVKRYSSGMYVRLAFAVAAHLEPEILVVDEVLAVGDVQFQEKCMGKMQTIGSEGRTVIFVSHNMNAIRSLCKNAILLKQGQLYKYGLADEVIRYNRVDSQTICNFEYKPLNPLISNSVGIISVRVDFDGEKIDNSKKLTVECVVLLEKSIKVALSLFVYREGDLAFIASDYHVPVEEASFNPGMHKVSFVIPPYMLNPGLHRIGIVISDFNGNTEQLFACHEILSFMVDDDGYRRNNRYLLGWGGAVSPILEVNRCFLGK